MPKECKRLAELGLPTEVSPHSAGKEYLTTEATENVEENRSAPARTDTPLLYLKPYRAQALCAWAQDEPCGPEEGVLATAPALT